MQFSLRRLMIVVAAVAATAGFLRTAPVAAAVSISISVFCGALAVGSVTLAHWLAFCGSDQGPGTVRGCGAFLLVAATAVLAILCAFFAAYGIDIFIGR